MTAGRLDLDRVLKETFVARAEYHPVIGSTNDRAIRCAAEAADELPLLVVADEQTAGRGRGTNRWWTGRGSLALSLLLDADCLGATQQARSPLVSLAAAVAVVDTVAPLLGARSVGIHWPNDAIAAGGKLAGILVEVLGDRRHVVGIGVNTNNSLTEAPPELKETASTLLELTGVTHDQTGILVALLQHLERLLGQLASDPDQVGIRADALCLQHGERLRLQLGDRSIVGRCLGIAADGALRLDTPEGRQTFRTGTLRRS